MCVYELPFHLYFPQASTCPLLLYLLIAIPYAGVDRTLIGGLSSDLVKRLLQRYLFPASSVLCGTNSFDDDREALCTKPLARQAAFELLDTLCHGEEKIK